MPQSGVSFTRTSINGPQRRLHLTKIWKMRFCVMGNNAIQLHFGQWQFPSGLDVLFGPLHGKGGTDGAGGEFLFRIGETN